ncbi:DDE-type integrase/transposase/recombinase, partial [Acinetobacter baumannii]|nr:DDE-type integrase/transposase/recombinase [Acinetobacter baumannii]
LSLISGVYFNFVIGIVSQNIDSPTNPVRFSDHGKLKRIIKATLGFKSMKTAYATIKGIEVMRALRKGQASLFYNGNILGEVWLVNRVFGL